MRTGRPLRIALIQTQAENAGAQEISRLLARGLEARGHEVCQIFFFRRTASFDDVANVAFCAPARPSTPWGVVKLVSALVGEVRRRRVDVALTFQHYGNLLGAPCCRLGGVRRVVANQNTAKRSLPLPFRLADLLYGILGLYDRIVVNSAESEVLYARYSRYGRRVVRIDHGFADKTVAISQADARTALGLPPGVPLLGCAARLHPLKNQAAAIRTLSVNTAHHLALAGQGADADALVRLAKDLGVSERLHVLGEIASDQMGIFFAALDVFVFPSLAETFGLAPAEAAQAGVPVLANRLPILEEVLAVAGEPCALFVDVDDTAAFAAAARGLVDDRALAGTLSERGRRLKTRFPLDAMVRRYAELIEGLP